MTPENLTLGKGELWFKPLGAAGFEFLGNCPAFTLATVLDTRTYFKSTSGVRVRQKTIVLDQTVTGAITCDAVTPANIARFINGNSATAFDGGVTAVTESLEGVIPGRRYQLGITEDSPFGARVIGDVGISGYVAGVDFKVDAVRGTIESISVTGNILVSYTRYPSTGTQIVTSRDEIEGELKFYARNTTGENIDWWMPSVRLTPNGEMQLISDTWGTLNFNIECFRANGLDFLYADANPDAFPVFIALVDVSGALLVDSAQSNCVLVIPKSQSEAEQ